MAYAEKRGDTLTGSWYGEIHLKKQQLRFRRRFKTKPLAEAYEAHIKAHGEEPDWARDTEATEVGRTFKAVADELKAAGGPDGVWARGRDRSVLQRLEYICASKLGRAAIEKVTYTLAEELVKGLKEKRGHAVGEKMSPNTINRYLTAISSVLTYAEKKDYIATSPKLPWQREVKKKKHTYSHTQQAAVEAALTAKGYTVEAFLLGVLARGGLRSGELLGLNPEQIEDDFIKLDDPEGIKNETTREVYIGEESARKLRAIVAGKHMPNYHTLYDRVREAIKTCGYTIPRPLHALRHTAATRTLDVELDVQVAQQLLGHKTIQTTLGYRHVSRDVLRERAKKLHPQRGKEPENTAEPVLVDFKKQA